MPKVRPGWGSLRPPSARDMGRKRTKVAKPFDFLVVLDFEWTADNRQPVKPINEITQFPSVLVKLNGRESCVIDEFNSYVKPTFNPQLSDFAIRLTGITQDMVDSSPVFESVLESYLLWLHTHGLINDSHERVGNWAICTWSDADIGGQLIKEIKHKGFEIPPCFDKWVNLKVFYKQHYRIEPKGGLQKCVERLGLKFEGRAHDGLVDSRNTASIVLHMARGSPLYGSFVFKRATRGLDRDGNPYGSRAAIAAREERLAKEKAESKEK
eukprot:m.340813 g.340813  ORF g.340813 m.340813 type:complete len:268 (-) comp19568_c0_seq1:183-986(-)